MGRGGWRRQGGDRGDPNVGPELTPALYDGRGDSGPLDVATGGVCRGGACPARKQDSAGGLQVFHPSGGVYVLVDQAVEVRFSADLLCVDVGHDGVGNVVLVVRHVLRDALVRPGGVVVRLVASQDSASIEYSSGTGLALRGRQRAMRSVTNYYLRMQAARSPDGAPAGYGWRGVWLPAATSGSRT